MSNAKFEIFKNGVLNDLEAKLKTANELINFIGKLTDELEKNEIPYRIDFNPDLINNKSVNVGNNYSYFRIKIKNGSLIVECIRNIVDGTFSYVITDNNEYFFKTKTTAYNFMQDAIRDIIGYVRKRIDP